MQGPRGQERLRGRRLRSDKGGERREQGRWEAHRAGHTALGAGVERVELGKRGMRGGRGGETNLCAPGDFWESSVEVIATDAGPCKIPARRTCHGRG